MVCNEYFLDPPGILYIEQSMVSTLLIYTVGTSHSQTTKLLPSVAQPYRRPDSFSHSQTYKQTPSVEQTPRSKRRQYLYTAGLPDTHTGTSQPAPATSAPPPTGPHVAQRQRYKNAGLQQASISSSISSTVIITSSSALGESSSRQQLYAP
jgi:hypothetical protein